MIDKPEMRGLRQGASRQRTERRTPLRPEREPGRENHQPIDKPRPEKRGGKRTAAKNGHAFPSTGGDFWCIKQGGTWPDGVACNWPVPAANSETALDDLWHAAVDGHGQFFSAKDPVTLSNAIASTLANVGARVGAGAAAYNSSVPTNLAPFSTQSLRLTQNNNGANAVPLSRTVTTGNLSMTNGSWTFAAWFNRATQTNDNFIFYAGTSKGFGGSGAKRARKRTSVPIASNDRGIVYGKC